MADDGSGNVINFPRVGFTSAAGSPPAQVAPSPDEAPFAAPTGEVLEGFANAPRRSPLDALAALGEPGLGVPFAASPGFVPDTFRPEGYGELVAPRLGALSLAAILAVSVAALRGIHSAVTARRASREQHQAVAKAARTAQGNDAGGRGAKKPVPPGHEYARKSLGRSPAVSAARSGGVGPGKSGRGGSGAPAGGSSGGKRTAPATAPTGGSGAGAKKPGGQGGGTPKGSSKSGSGKAPASGKSGSTRTPRHAGSVHRPSQGGATVGKTRRGSGKTSPGTPGAGGGKGPGGGLLKAPGGPAGPRGVLRRKKAASSGPATAKGSGKSGSDSSAPSKKGSTAIAGKKGRGTPTASGKATPPKGSVSGRTTLAEAVHKTAARRLKRRRKSATPPIWSATKTKRKATRPGTPKSPHTKATRAPKVKATSGKSQPAGAGGSRWGRVHGRARARWNKRATGSPGAGTTSSPGSSTPPGGGSSTPPSGGTTGEGAYGTGRRRSPWEAAGMASGDVTITVERADRVGDQARRWEQAAAGTGTRGLPAAPSPHTARPGTTKEKPTMSVPARATTAASGPASMAPEHTTEVTLDDTLTVLEKLTQDSFAAHDTCLSLAAKARRIRYALDELAADLYARHNILGLITSAAMSRLAESMERLAYKADEMSTSSLTAAELSESAEQAMFDAYKPVQQATADAGLAVPSARIHNEG